MTLLSSFNVNDHRSFAMLLNYRQAVAKERPEKFRPEQDSNPDLCDAGAVLHQLVGTATTGGFDDGVPDRKQLGRRPRSVDCQVTLRNNGFSGRRSELKCKTQFLV